jgi:hypothetical protein
MRGLYSTLSAAAVAASLLAVAIPTQAEAKSSKGSVTLTADQWAEIQAKLQEVDQLHQDVDALKAAQQTTQQQATQAQSTATQAQAAASQAQTAAVQAQTTATDASKDAKNAIVPVAWAKDTSISGRMYFNGSFVDREVNGTKTESDGGFQIKRFYLGIDHKFNNMLSANLTTDIDSVGAPNGSLVGKGLYVKKAYLQAKFSPAIAVRVGSADLPWVPYVEGLYGYRYVENVLVDRTKFGTSADWGVHALGDRAGGIVSYQFSAVGGGGYRDPKFTNTVDFEGRVSAKYAGFNAALGFYTGKLGKDVDGGAPAFHTASRFDALIAYKDPRFTVGAEYFAAKNWTQVNSPIEDKADGWSAFASAHVIPKISLFARYDWTKPHKDTLPGLTDEYFNGGVQYEAFKNVNVALVYKHDKAKNGTINTSNGVIGGSTDGTYDEIGLFGMFQF